MKVKNQTMKLQKAIFSVSIPEGNQQYKINNYDSKAYIKNQHVKMVEKKERAEFMEISKKSGQRHTSVFISCSMHGEDRTEVKKVYFYFLSLSP